VKAHGDERPLEPVVDTESLGKRIYVISEPHEGEACDFTRIIYKSNDRVVNNNSEAG
jgi:hypothetical protein